MGTFDLLPVADQRNQGWTPVGTSSLYEAWNNDDDLKYGSSPGHRGWAEVSFPIDTSSLPEGAVMTAVTVFLRARRTGSNIVDTHVTLVSTDGHERYADRSVYPTSTITTFEMGTFAKDPTGQPWDVHRLNQFRVLVQAFASVPDDVRVYKVVARVTYHTRPTVNIETPTGSASSPSPRVQWTYSHESGDAEDYSEYRIFTEADALTSSFNPDVNTPYFQNTVDAGVSSEILPESLPPGKYVIYMRSRSVYGAISKWSSREFEVTGPYPAIPGNDSTNSSPQGGTATVVTDPFEGSAHLTIRDSSNLLSVQQADFDVTEDHLGFLGTNCTLSRETLNVYTRGKGSLRVESTSGTASAVSTFVEVAASTPFTIRAQVLSAATARTATLSVQFYNSQFATVGSIVSANVVDSASTWKEIVATDTTPATAAYFKLTISFDSTAASEVHFVDRVGFMYGTNSPWSSGGHMSRNLLSAYLSTADAFGAAGSHFIANNASTTMARVAATGTGSHGENMFRMTYTGASPSIAHRATGVEFEATTSGTGFTLNKPGSAVDGDLLVAFVTTGTPSTMTVPNGWTLVNFVSTENNNGLYILKRTMLTGDPATWTGSFASASDRRYAIVMAYSGAAPATDQFLSDNVRSDPSGAQIHNTALINNSMSNTWRLSAFSVRNSSAGSFSSANIDPATTVPDIQYVGKGSPWQQGSGSSSYTINRPANVISGDLMLAYVSFQGTGTVTAPAGWTIANQEAVIIGSHSLTFAALKRTATSSEPASWSGSTSISAPLTMTGTEAFRYAKDASLQLTTPTVDNDISGSGSAESTHTDVLNNPSSSSIRVIGYASIEPYGTHVAVTSTENMRRHSGFADDNALTTQMTLSFFDSNGPVSTGDHQQVVYTGPPHWVGVAWFGLVTAQGTVPPPGANEAERKDDVIGSGSSFMHLGVFDSNGVAAVGPTDVYATFSSTSESVVSWIGIIKPASPSVAGLASVKMDSFVDISKLDPVVIERADQKITVVASFLGSTSGTPVFALEFYRANQLLTTVSAEAASFSSTVWSKASATFTLPEGTTRLRPIISALGRDVGDTISFDRLSVAMGDSTGWREGTGRAEHVVWSYPQVQYAEDDGTGYGDWKTLPGLSKNPPEYDPITGLVTFADHSIVPLKQRRYRIQTVSHGLAGDKFVSGYGSATAEVSFIAKYWWLKDIDDPTKNLLLKVDWDAWTVRTTGTAEEFQTLGEDLPFVVGEGFKGDKIEVQIWTNKEEYQALERLVRSRKSLFLQSDVNRAWWVRIVGDISHDVQPTLKRQTNPLRLVTVQFTQVKAEE